MRMVASDENRRRQYAENRSLRKTAEVVWSTVGQRGPGGSALGLVGAETVRRSDTAACDGSAAPAKRPMTHCPPSPEPGVARLRIHG